VTAPEASRLSIRFYATASGREPVRDWLAELDRTTLRVIGEDLRTVQIGWPLGMPLVRKLEPKLWEVRISVPAGIARVLFTLVENELVLLLAFIKKSPATPKDELALARRRMKEVHRG
jgi:phage-related protein